MMPELINPRAGARTRSLYRLLRELQGKKILLAQQEMPRSGCPGREMEWIEAVTGELPAIRGLDFIHDDFAGVVDRAKDWNDRGGIVTICWHTGIEGNDYIASKEESPDWDRLMTPGTAENDLLLRRWDDAARALLRLQEADVPVLWRPFHEFDGAWFWWGKGGGERLVALWRMMLRRFTDEYGLNNLIWVLGYADDVPDGWDPGEACFDIAGSDTYRRETAHAAAFARLRKMYPDKLLAFHECGMIPPVDRFFEENCPWSWLMPWHTMWVFNNGPARLKDVYHDERTVALSRLKSF